MKVVIVMCGRFLIEYDIEDVIATYGIKQVNNKTSIKGEVFPGNKIPFVLDRKARTLDFQRWGFKVAGRDKEVINARIETALEKPTFRRAFINNRCIIPASAFFEWETTEKSKVKYKIEVKESKLFSMAGIYDIFTDKDNKEYVGVVILTRPSNEEMSKLHHRMPVFIEDKNQEEWLRAPAKDISFLKEALEKECFFKLNISPAEGARQLSMFDFM